MPEITYTQLVLANLTLLAALVSIVPTLLLRRHYNKIDVTESEEAANKLEELEQLKIAHESSIQDLNVKASMARTERTVMTKLIWDTSYTILAEVVRNTNPHLDIRDEGIDLDGNFSARVTVGKETVAIFSTMASDPLRVTCSFGRINHGGRQYIRRFLPRDLIKARIDIEKLLKIQLLWAVEPAQSVSA